jgi:hypothetical protein
MADFSRMTDAEYKTFMYERIKSNYAFQISAKPRKWLEHLRDGLKRLCREKRWPVDDFAPEFAAIDEQLELKE